jgi:hypothetical protein
MEIFELLFLVIFKIILLSAYMENTNHGKKRRKTEHISANTVMVHHKKWRSILSIPDMGWI